MNRRGSLFDCGSIGAGKAAFPGREKVPSGLFLNAAAPAPPPGGGGDGEVLPEHMAEGGGTGVAILLRQLLDGGAGAAELPLGQLEPVEGEKPVGRAVHSLLEAFVQVALGDVDLLAEPVHRELGRFHPAQRVDAPVHQLGTGVRQHPLQSGGGVQLAAQHAQHQVFQNQVGGEVSAGALRVQMVDQMVSRLAVEFVQHSVQADRGGAGEQSGEIGLHRRVRKIKIGVAVFHGFVSRAHGGIAHEGGHDQHVPRSERKVQRAGFKPHLPPEQKHQLVAHAHGGLGRMGRRAAKQPQMANVEPETFQCVAQRVPHNGIGPEGLHGPSPPFSLS